MMLKRVRNLIAFFVVGLSLLLVSCSDGLSRSKSSTVAFSIDAQTVNQILQEAAMPEAAVPETHSAIRAATDDASQTSQNSNSSQTEEKSAYNKNVDETADAPYDSLFIKVSLLGGDNQSRAKVIVKDKPVSFVFDEVPLLAVVYAQAEVYTYTDQYKETKNILYSGESSKITVTEYENNLTFTLKKAVLTVTFETNGGRTKIEPVKVKTGQKVERPENPIGDKISDKTVKAFGGWFIDKDLTILYNFDLPVTENITLYAKWIEDFVYVEGATVNDYLASGRNVEIPNLYVSQHEVTQAEYYAITQKNPSSHKIDNVSKSNYPVEKVSWYDAIVYCNLLSIKEELNPCYSINDSVDPKDWGSVPTSSSDEWNNVSFDITADGYRLPTEAEWEYIAGKGIGSKLEKITDEDEKSKAYDKLVLYKEHSIFEKYTRQTQQETNRQTDDLGLCNILGNVSEWCFDWYTGSVAQDTGATGAITGTARVHRGGSVYSSKSECAVNARASASPATANEKIGFRVVRTVQAASKDCTIEFDSDCEIEIEVQIIVSGKRATEPEPLTKEGYIFQNWVISGTQKAFSFTTPVSQNLKLKAVWIPEVYKITYVLNEGENPEDAKNTYTIEDNVILPQATKTDYAFGGWYTTKDFEDGTKVTRWSATEKTGDITLYAKWNVDEFTIEYIMNKGEWVEGYEAQETYKLAEDFELPKAEDIVLEGHLLEGWYYDEHFTDGPVTGWSADSGKSGNITLHAKWVPITYTVKFDANGGTGEMEDQKISWGEERTLPANAFEAPAGMNFDGWTLEKDAEEADFADKETIKSLSTKDGDEITLYAKWSYPKTFVVTIQAGIWSSGTGTTEFKLSSGGTNLAEGTTLTGSGQVTLTATSLTGYTYTWKVDGSTTDSSGNAYSSTNTLTIDVTNWTKGVYDITVIATDGTNYKSCYGQIKVGY